MFYNGVVIIFDEMDYGFDVKWESYVEYIYLFLLEIMWILKVCILLNNNNYMLKFNMFVYVGIKFI